jgi:hypothetical protein
MMSSLWVEAPRVLVRPSCWGDVVAAYSCAMWGNLGIRRHELYTVIDRTLH